MNHLELIGVFTHFACSVEKTKEPAYQQLKIFQNFLTKIEELHIPIPFKHCANSASILELPESNMDLVRAGITLYGLRPSPEVSMNRLPLRPALSFCSHIVLVKTLEIGESVSYGSTFTASKRTKIATIPIGYGDGYPRSLSNKGYVLIKGKRAPIIGRICMDQFMVDISMIEDVYEGELVTLIGTNHKEQITAEELGEISGRFNYELVCDIGKRIPRVYIKNGNLI